MNPTSLNFNKFAFAQQDPVLPNYRGDHRTLEPSKVLNNQTTLASGEIQPSSLVHYQPITPANHYYTGSSNEASINSFPTSIANMVNSTNPSSVVQPISLTHYQPIAPASSAGSPSSTDTIFSGDHESSLTGSGNEHTSTNDDGHSSNDNSHSGGSHSSSNDNSHSGGSHSDSGHKSTSNHSHNHHSSDHSSSGHHGASASASAGGGGASASAG